MQLTLASEHDGRPRLGLPTTALINAYAEVSQGGPTESVRTTRPGLTKVFDVGTGPILAMYQKPTLFNGDLFAISGSTVYRCPEGGTPIALGTVAYSQTPQIAAADDLMAIVSGGALYIYDGSTLKLQQYFDDGVSLLPQFSGVSVLYSIFVYPQENSFEFYFSAVGNPASINAANFSAAQVFPDSIVQSYVLAEQLYFFKNTSVELWYFQGQLTAPFALSQGQTYQRGCAVQASVRICNNFLCWIGDDFQVYISGTVPQKISTSYIDDRIGREAVLGTIGSVTSLVYDIEGHVCYVINLPSLKESYAYDFFTQKWFRLGTQLPSQFEPGVFQGAISTGQGLITYIGSYNDGRIFVLDVDNMTDDGLPIQVTVSAFLWLGGGVHRNNNVSLQMVRGIGTSSTPYPLAFMRYSDDGGRTWSSWLQGSLGTIGTYRYKASWRSLGIVKQPGRIFNFRISDDVNVTIEGVSANEARI